MKLSITSVRSSRGASSLSYLKTMMPYETPRVVADWLAKGERFLHRLRGAAFPSGRSSSLESMARAASSVTDAFEGRVRELEETWLSPLAVRSYESRGRRRPEDPPRLRTPFQRDRDRIVHTKAFRRLKHKTQVFVAPAGDHYRTRLSHTLETTMISRGVARALRLNEDLTEAIGLGHDLGHPAFGHAGEAALDELLQQRYGRRFRHNEQSLRVVDALERGGRGLNLCHEVRDGILTHTGDRLPETLEGRIVRLVDRVAYINHDIDDAVRAGILGPPDLPRRELELLGETSSRRIATLVEDLVETSEREGDIRQSDAVGEAMLALRTFMFERVYLAPSAASEQRRVARVVHDVFDAVLANPDLLPPGPGDVPQRVTDYVAGMTDRFALAFHDRL
jgi:dGTPase